MDSIELLARFAYQPNALNYCGPSDANKVLRQYIIHKDNTEETKKTLMKFEALKPYIGYIAERTGKDFFNYDVIEAYCLGNSLLGNFTKVDLIEITNRLKLPDSISKNIIKNMPNCVPQHSFNVVHVGVGAITGSVKTCLENMDNCLVHDAVVKEILEGELIVFYQPLEYINRYYWGFFTDKKVKYDKELLPGLKIGDNVGIHWNFAAMKLNAKELNNLKHYNFMNINAINDKIKN